MPPNHADRIVERLSYALEIKRKANGNWEIDAIIRAGDPSHVGTRVPIVSGSGPISAFGRSVLEDYAAYGLEQLLYFCDYSDSVYSRR